MDIKKASCSTGITSIAGMDALYSERTIPLCGAGRCRESGW